MNSGWEKMSFAQVFLDETRGNKKLLQSEYLPAGEYPIVDQGKALIAGYTNDESYICKSDLPVIVFGDHTKCLKFIDFPFCLGADGTKVLRPIIQADERYLYYALQTLHIPDAGYSRHFKYLKQCEIPIPSLEEQRQIAALLDQADALRRLRQQSIDRLDALGQAIFHDMFGDPASNSKGWQSDRDLGDVAEIVSGITKGRKIGKQQTRLVPYLAVINVQDRQLQLDPLKQIEATEEEIDKYRLVENDLLLTEGGDPDKLGRGTIWRGELEECIYQNHIFRVRLNDERINPVFLNWIVGSNRGKAYFLRSAKQTTGIASINKRQLREFPLLIPPHRLQKKFAQCVEEIGCTIAQYNHSQHVADQLFSALQQRAFAGEL